MSKYALIALPLILLSVPSVSAQSAGPPPVNKVNAERMRQHESS
jgi:hypothetical protein